MYPKYHNLFHTHCHHHNIVFLDYQYPIIEIRLFEMIFIRSCFSPDQQECDYFII